MTPTEVIDSVITAAGADSTGKVIVSALEKAGHAIQRREIRITYQHGDADFPRVGCQFGDIHGGRQVNVTGQPWGWMVYDPGHENCWHGSHWRPAGKAETALATELYISRRGRP